MTQEEKWNIMYSLLVKYYKENENVEVPISFITDDGEKLGIWVSTQRTRFRINKLSTERKEKLRLLGFRFEKMDFDAVWDARWEYMYNLLEEYKKENDSVEVPVRFVTKSGDNLGTWVNTQRNAYENNKLTLDKEEKLRLLGFRFEKIDFDAVWAARWEYMYNLLINYKKRYGDTDVSSEYKTINGEKLGTWVRTQRAMYRNNRLAPNKEEKLRLLGFRFYNSENDEEIEESKPLTRIRKR